MEYLVNDGKNKAPFPAGRWKGCFIAVKTGTDCLFLPNATAGPFPSGGTTTTAANRYKKGMHINHQVRQTYRLFRTITRPNLIFYVKIINTAIMNMV
jgi:hypothetical protein